jgi:alpha-mannosidase
MQIYSTLAPLNSFGFTKFTFVEETIKIQDTQMFEYSANSVENDFYTLSFNKDGSFTLSDKKNVLEFKEMHKFEDWGDRGDEYTFGRLGPEMAKVSGVKRRIITEGLLFCEIEQTMKLQLFEQINDKRDKRIGKVSIPVTTTFKFYKNLPRIDINTKLINQSKDHRLRICFDLPFASEETITSTHFGFTKRKSDPAEEEIYEETPSGIQAQKRFIRVEDSNNDIAITLMNRGLPEVELANNSRLALTLIRSTGYLSRADYPERPMHAGPFLETPGAQELNTEYSFDYSIMVHEKTLPIHQSFNQAEISCLDTKSVVFYESHPKEGILEEIIKIDNPWIKISSLRMKDNKILITLYNLDENNHQVRAELNSKLSSCIQRKIDGTKVQNISFDDISIEIDFDPFEIKILELV